MARLNVVAGILFDADRRVLIAERVEDGPFQGMWEFPGGKMAPGESATTALLRELKEELGIVVTHSSSFMQLKHDYADRSVDLHFFMIHEWQGTPEGLDGQRLRWLQPTDIEDSIMLPADAPVIEAIRKTCP